jgi:hypothetical protein
MNTELRKALIRLKQRFGRERARLERWETKDRAIGPSGAQHAERCRNEATQWSLAMGMVDAEIRKVMP